MTFGRLTTKWRIFRSDLPSEHGTETNCRIIHVGAKLHNYVINSDNLNFRNTPDEDWESLEVEKIDDGPEGNSGYLPTPFQSVRLVGVDVNCNDRRNVIVEDLQERILS